ncbi:hypothetical protein [Actinoplanes sp. TFC3]|uniref:hypothetical protein n=1 Tax=Actinoplanes sp. TFC3 TaxID=1710355 RepID=UPI00082AD06F|nr:hypothetical protein [Actinoplanes sp. TFC3]
MTEVLLSLHVLATISAIGPVTVAAGMFPGVLRRATPDGVPILRTLHRICRVYAGLGSLVPMFGLATASSLGRAGRRLAHRVDGADRGCRAHPDRRNPGIGGLLATLRMRNRQTRPALT